MGGRIIESLGALAAGRPPARRLLIATMIVAGADEPLSDVVALVRASFRRQQSAAESGDLTLF